MNNFDRIRKCESQYEMADLICGYFSSNLHKLRNKESGEWSSLPFLEWLKSDRNIFGEELGRQ